MDTSDGTATRFGGNGEVKVFYSTPFGDTNDGEQRLFLLEREGVRYMPVFRSVDSMKEFYGRMNRAAYTILEGDVQTVMDTNRSIEPMKDVGVVIEPLTASPVILTPRSD
ncbi:hypothetical protein H7I77_24725 [Mycolicibacterium novocastrense]|uniref:SseB protein N-terminal domain-containing protein n=1 Tax=Mycolicibacterium novocastrense TaxID=59813 RepID=A0AAW5SSF6_MYCNV|nr:hypothetical protein [Mycolicibacterium novocastrense]MCV7026522.1 hypothetical protein [Mycolicibacterium novocastrense]GAT08482.1 uncharacterized protein RMCN_1615 [Mycolicibacterium novocastrense]